MRNCAHTFCFAHKITSILNISSTWNVDCFLLFRAGIAVHGPLVTLCKVYWHLISFVNLIWFAQILLHQANGMTSHELFLFWMYQHLPSDSTSGERFLCSLAYKRSEPVWLNRRHTAPWIHIWGRSRGQLGRSPSRWGRIPTHQARCLQIATSEEVLGLLQHVFLHTIFVV